MGEHVCITVIAIVGTLLLCGGIVMLVLALAYPKVLSGDSTPAKPAGYRFATPKRSAGIGATSYRPRAKRSYQRLGAPSAAKYRSQEVRDDDLNGNQMLIADCQGNFFFTNFHVTPDAYAQPGPTYYSPTNCRINRANGRLTLEMVQRKTPGGPRWTGAEAMLTTPINYGATFFTAKFLDGFDAYDGSHDWNTTFGGFTFKSGKTCYPNLCNEIDLIEWGKSRKPQQPGLWQVGMQYWANCDEESGGRLPDPNKCTVKDWNSVNQERLPRGPDLNEAQKDAIRKADNTLTFRLLWPGPHTPITIAINPGDFGARPWDPTETGHPSSFPTNPMYTWTSSPRQNLFVPVADAQTFLHFNLWTVSKPPDASKADPKTAYGPADGKAKSVEVWNVAIPYPPPSPSVR